MFSAASKRERFAHEQQEEFHLDATLFRMSHRAHDIFGGGVPAGSRVSTAITGIRNRFGSRCRGIGLEVTSQR